MQHGDRVCLFMPNCIEYLYCWFGLSELGAISVPINTAYRRDETAYILNNAEAVALVTDPSLADVAGAAADLAPSIRHRILRGDEPANGGWTSFQTPSTVPRRCPTGTTSRRTTCPCWSTPRGRPATPKA